MEAQTFINVAFALCGAFGGWVLNTISRSIIRLEDRVAEFPLAYVSREDYREDMHEIKAILNRIADKLDAKVDKK